MFVAVLTVAVLVVISVIMVVVRSVVTVLPLLETEGHGGLVPGCYVEPALLLQSPSGLVSLGFQLSQSSSDELLL